MTAHSSSAVQTFVEYFGELGQRWGLPSDACRVHALLYLLTKPADEREITKTLELDDSALKTALKFLHEYQMAERTSSSKWQTNADPWVLLLQGLEQRRRRELPLALSILQECESAARNDSAMAETTLAQIGKMRSLVEDLAALDSHARRVPPHLVRGFVGVSGRAARLVDQVIGRGRGKGS